MRPLVPLLALLAVVACSSGDFGGGGLGKAKSKKKADASKSADDDDGDIVTDEENEQAQPPAEVAGAFLTLDCGPAAPGDGVTAAAGNDPYGCRLLDENGAKYGGALTLKKLDVTFADAPKEAPALTDAADGSKWHKGFSLAKAHAGKVTGYAAEGTAGDQPLNAAITVEPTAAFCTPPKFQVKEDGIYAAEMSLLAMDEGGNGLPAQRILANLTLKIGDVLTLKEAKGKSIARVAGDGTTKYVNDCPSGFQIHFADATGKRIADGQNPAASSFKTGRAVPDTAASAWVGFHEKEPGFYSDNEGMPGRKVKDGSSTDGCKLVLELARSQCE